MPKSADISGITPEEKRKQARSVAEIEGAGVHLHPEAVKAILDANGVPATDVMTDAPVLGDPDDEGIRSQLFHKSDVSSTLKPYAVVVASRDPNALGDTLRQEFEFYERNKDHLRAMGVDPDAAREFYVVYNQGAHWVTAKVSVDKNQAGLRTFGLDVFNSLGTGSSRHEYQDLGNFPGYLAVGEYSQHRIDQQSLDDGSYNTCGIRAALNTVSLIKGEAFKQETESALRARIAAQVKEHYARPAGLEVPRPEADAEAARLAAEAARLSAAARETNPPATDARRVPAAESRQEQSARPASRSVAEASATTPAPAKAAAKVQQSGDAQKKNDADTKKLQEDSKKLQQEITATRKKLKRSLVKAPFDTVDKALARLETGIAGLSFSSATSALVSMLGLMKQVLAIIPDTIQHSVAVVSTAAGYSQDISGKTKAIQIIDQKLNAMNRASSRIAGNPASINVLQDTQQDFLRAVGPNTGFAANERARRVSGGSGKNTGVTTPAARPANFREMVQNRGPREIT